MNFYYQDKQGKVVQIEEEEAREHLEWWQINEGIEAKQADPCEEVSYMIDGGFIIIDF